LGYKSYGINFTPNFAVYRTEEHLVFEIDIPDMDTKSVDATWYFEGDNYKEFKISFAKNEPKALLAVKEFKNTRESGLSNIILSLPAHEIDIAKQHDKDKLKYENGVLVICYKLKH